MEYTLIQERLHTVSHSIFIWKLGKFGLDDWSIKEPENWLPARLKGPTSTLMSEYPGVHTEAV